MYMCLGNPRSAFGVEGVEGQRRISQASRFSTQS